MVSKLYTAKTFYELQRKGRIGSVYADSKRLKKDKQGFYVIRKRRDSSIYKQRINSNDLVYTRQENGVTLYDVGRDKSKRKVRTKKETSKEHQPNQHKYDRINKNNNNTFI